MPASRITLDLLRRRAEHNNGDLATLEEITLHQFDIERIELLDAFCPNLRIVYLQNNLVSRIEGLSRLVHLDYLNLALNNITCIEGLRGCESLRKLDLTLNFITGSPLTPENTAPAANMDFERGLGHLGHYCTRLRELFLTGNPVSRVPQYRLRVILLVPQITALDGQPVLESERIRARLMMEAPCRHHYHHNDSIVHDIVVDELDNTTSANANGIDDTNELPTQEELDSIDQMNPEDAAQALSKEGKATPYTRAERIRTARQMARARARPGPNDSVPRKHKMKAEIKRSKTTGCAMQYNTAKVKYRVHEECPYITVIEIAIPRTIHTEEIDVCVEHDAVCIAIRNRKGIQLRINSDTIPDGSDNGHVVVVVDPLRSASIRSQATGTLYLYLLHKSHATMNPIECDASELFIMWQNTNKQMCSNNNNNNNINNNSSLKMLTPGKNQHDSSHLDATSNNLQQRQHFISTTLNNKNNDNNNNKKKKNDSDFEDDPSVPPLI